MQTVRQGPMGATASSKTPPPSAKPSAALLTPAQAARDVFGISERSFHELRKSAWMPKPVVLGPRLIRFVRAELEAACAAMPRGTVAEPGQLSRSRIKRIAAKPAGQ